MYVFPWFIIAQMFFPCYILYISFDHQVVYCEQNSTNLNPFKLKLVSVAPVILIVLEIHDSRIKKNVTTSRRDLPRGVFAGRYAWMSCLSRCMRSNVKSIGFCSQTCGHSQPQHLCYTQTDLTAVVYCTVSVWMWATPCCSNKWVNRKRFHSRTSMSPLWWYRDGKIQWCSHYRPYCV